MKKHEKVQNRHEKSVKKRDFLVKFGESVWIGPCVRGFLNNTERVLIGAEGP